MDPKDSDALPPSPSPEEIEATRISSESERAAALKAVLRHEEERKRARAAVRPPLPTPLLHQLVPLVLTTAAAAYLWLGSPSWLERKPVPPPSVEVEEAHLRVAMYFQAQRIEHYREMNGRLPAFVEEAGPPLPGVRYRRLDAQTYRIQGHTERLQIVYSSDTPLADLMGRGEEFLPGKRDG